MIKKLKIKNFFYLIFIIFVALFFYTFNLRYTYFFSGDSARDTLASLKILNNKEITAIGPPLSFGQYGIREIYFSSLTYYAGALGLSFFNKDVLGPVYVNIFLMILGIFFFYKLTCLFLKPKIAFLSTLMFSLSPTIVAHMRFFWNPNFVISLSPIYWYFYFLALNKNRCRDFLLSGLFAGILFHFHYFVIFTLFVSLIFIFYKNKKGFWLFILAFITVISPLIIFEIKNKFYLTNAFFYNITINKDFHNVYRPIFSRPVWLKITDIFLIPVIFLAFETEATHFPTIVNLNYWSQVSIGFLIYWLIIYFLKKNQKSFNQYWIFVFILTSLTAIFSSFFAHKVYYLRYFFICLPLLILIIVRSFRNEFLFFLLLMIFLITDYRILYSQKAHNDLIKVRKTSYPTINHMEKVAVKIKSNHPKTPYNITENFSGDARALYLRFFIERDNQIPKPENELTYQNLKELYVFSPSLKEIYKDNRWEFNATTNLKLVKTWRIDKNKYLFKFEKINY